MKKFLAGLGWLLSFGSLGAAAMSALAMLAVPHHIPVRALLRVAVTGVAPGALCWTIAICFAALPGARQAPGSLPRFGLAQGVWSILGTALMMFCGALLPYTLALYASLLRILRHEPSHMPDMHNLQMLAASLLASELMAALWVAWYLNRQSKLVLVDGSARGIAWRAASGTAYQMAALGALAALALGVAEFRFAPPDMSKLNNLPMAQLLQGPPVIVALVLVVTVLLAPVLEEVLFRGLAFAGIATRLGAGWAVAITTLVFTALHAPEKIYYLPGFADVAAVALISCALRLRYRSIRPGILLHFLYNFGMLVVPALS